MALRDTTAFGLLRSMRPHQWVKNLFVLAPVVFARELLNISLFSRAMIAFSLFCCASSAVYLLNDIADADADRAHPVKRNRPIASGLVSLRTATLAMTFLAVAAVGGGFALSPPFGAALLAYLILNIAYSSKLKRVAYLDVLCIATGFELRVLGGAFAAAVPPSSYLLLVTFLLALFLGFGKRTHELVQGERAHEQRRALQFYDLRILTRLLFATAVLTVATYAAYTLDPNTRRMFKSDYLVITTAFTGFGVWRFLRLVRTQPEVESPTEQMLRDIPFLGNLALWVICVMAILYFA